MSIIHGVNGSYPSRAQWVDPGPQAITTDASSENSRPIAIPQIPLTPLKDVQPLPKNAFVERYGNYMEWPSKELAFAVFMTHTTLVNKNLVNICVEYTCDIFDELFPKAPSPPAELITFLKSDCTIPSWQHAKNWQVYIPIYFPPNLTLPDIIALHRDNAVTDHVLAEYRDQVLANTKNWGVVTVGSIPGSDKYVTENDRRACIPADHFELEVSEAAYFLNIIEQLTGIQSNVGWFHCRAVNDDNRVVVSGRPNGGFYARHANFYRFGIKLLRRFPTLQAKHHKKISV